MNRDPLFDFLRSVFMLFVFWHHFYLTFPDVFDYVKWFNPFAELFVGLAGFMIGWIYLKRRQDYKLFKRGSQVLLAYWLVAVPYQMLIDPNIQSLTDALLLNTSDTLIEILKFYGVLFLAIPILLFAIRRFKWIVVVLSGVVYMISLQVNFDGIFWDVLINTLMTYQFYFVIGILLGDLYSKSKLINRQTFIILSTLSLTAISAHYAWFNFNLGVEYYNIPKALNNVYMMFSGVLLIYSIHRLTKSTWLYNNILVIGRHSLAAFVISEVTRILLLQLPIMIFAIEVNEFLATVASLVFALLLIWLVNQYAKIKTELRGLNYATNNDLRLHRH